MRMSPLLGNGHSVVSCATLLRRARKATARISDGVVSVHMMYILGLTPLPTLRDAARSSPVLPPAEYTEYMNRATMFTLVDVTTRSRVPWSADPDNICEAKACAKLKTNTTTAHMRTALSCAYTSRYRALPKPKKRTA